MGDNPERLNTEASFAESAPSSTPPAVGARAGSTTAATGRPTPALHRIVFTRLRHDPRTQAYCERRTQEGKTRREIVRCLKRYAAREVFNLVRPISRTPAL
ncbi:hypothetical protein ABTX60_40905 [Streptomyces sp. NPDC126510]|uniref:hypothetical protein n=1 Tax=Streptomyces sp. NPDC126510 TaxID=3155317 RepID=UPI0033287F40